MSSSTKEVEGVEVFTPEIPERGALGIGPSRLKSVKKRLDVQVPKKLSGSKEPDRAVSGSKEPDRVPVPDLGETELDIDVLKLDHELQPRVRMDTELVSEYAEMMSEGVKFGPISVTRVSGKFYVTDGFHRVKAAKKMGAERISAIVTEGSRDDAVLESCRSNIGPMGRTSEDLKRAVAMFYSVKPTASSRVAAAHIGVRHKAILKYKALIEQEKADSEPIPEAQPEDKVTSVTRVVNGKEQTYTMKTPEGRKPTPVDEDLKGLSTPRAEAPNMIFRLQSSGFVNDKTVALYFLISQLETLPSMGLAAQILRTGKNSIEQHLSLLQHWGLIVEVDSSWKVVPDSKVAKTSREASHFDKKGLSFRDGELSLTPSLKDFYLKSLSILKSNAAIYNNNIAASARRIGASDIRKTDTFAAAKTALADHFTDTELNPKSFGLNASKWFAILLEAVQDPEDFNNFGWWYKRVGPYLKSGFSWALAMACWDRYMASRSKVKSQRKKELATKDTKKYWDTPENKKWVEDTLKDLEAAVAAVEEGA